MVVFFACSTSAKLVGEGGECMQATDCQEGLICAPPKDEPLGKRTCTGDLSRVEPPPPVDAGVDTNMTDANVIDAGDADAADDMSGADTG